MAPHSSILAWKIPWSEGPRGLQSMWPQRVRHRRLTEHSFIHSWASLLAGLLAFLRAGLCLILCDPLDGSPTGSPVPGVPQAKTLEWVAISFSNA